VNAQLQHVVEMGLYSDYIVLDADVIVAILRSRYNDLLGTHSCKFIHAFTDYKTVKATSKLSSVHA